MALPNLCGEVYAVQGVFHSGSARPVPGQRGRMGAHRLHGRLCRGSVPIIAGNPSQRVGCGDLRAVLGLSLCVDRRHDWGEHDDMNVICLGSRVVGTEVAKELVSAFLKAEFSGAERHVRRLNKVKQLEEETWQESTKDRLER